jgi:hypothetical protein
LKEVVLFHSIIKTSSLPNLVIKKVYMYIYVCVYVCVYVWLCV